MDVNQRKNEYIEAFAPEAFDLLVELAQIPAPSHKEHKRALFCKEFLEKQGAQGVYIDDALNVIYPIGCEGNKPIVVFAAHSDVVFPDEEPLPLHIEGDRLYCPGVGDDTGNVVALLSAAKFIANEKLLPINYGILLVVNSCEEGLGNLKGCRRLMEQYGQRACAFVTFDLSATKLYDRSVGSRRFQISVQTQGGHSLNDFGKPNAIACLAKIISKLYEIQVPSQGRTTYNVGTVQGGTSVNTIAQSAHMLYEFRSDQSENLDWMQEQLDGVLSQFISRGMDVSCQLVGERPCALNVPEKEQKRLADRAAYYAQKHFGITPKRLAASTDCNIPLSMGIPSVCIGCLYGAGEHTREEYVEISSLKPGLHLALDFILSYFD